MRIIADVTCRLVQFITQRHSIAERGTCFQRRLFVCQFVFVCLFVNTITSERSNRQDDETWRLGYVHSTKISPEIECQGQLVKGEGHRGQKKRKSAAFCSGVVLWGAVLVQHFSRSGPRGTVTPVGKSAHAV